MNLDSRGLIKHGWTSNPPSMAARRGDGRVQVLRPRGTVSQAESLGSHRTTTTSVSGTLGGMFTSSPVSHVQCLKNEDELDPPQREISQYASFCHRDFFSFSLFSSWALTLPAVHTSHFCCTLPNLSAPLSISPGFCSVSCVSISHIAYCLCLPPSSHPLFAFLRVILFVCVSLCVSGLSGARGKEPACQRRRLKRCGFDP